MKGTLLALAALLILAACTTTQAEDIKQPQAGATLLNLREYQQGSSYAFQCDTVGFTPSTYAWDFGDGTTRTTTYKGVAHTYFKSGTYTVTCVAGDDLTNATSTTTVTAAVESEQYEPQPNDSFSDLGIVDLLADTSPYLTYNTTPNASIQEMRRSTGGSGGRGSRQSADTIPDTGSTNTRGTANNTTNATSGIGALADGTTDKSNTTVTSTNITPAVTVPNTTTRQPNATPNASAQANTTAGNTTIIISNTTGDAAPAPTNSTASNDTAQTPPSDTTGNATGTTDPIIDIKLPPRKAKKLRIADLKQ